MYDMNNKNYIYVGLITFEFSILLLVVMFFIMEFVMCIYLLLLHVY